MRVSLNIFKRKHFRLKWKRYIILGRMRTLWRSILKFPYSWFFFCFRFNSLSFPQCDFDWILFSEFSEWHSESVFKSLYADCHNSENRPISNEFSSLKQPSNAKQAKSSCKIQITAMPPASLRTLERIIQNIFSVFLNERVYLVISRFVQWNIIY